MAQRPGRTVLSLTLGLLTLAGGRGRADLRSSAAAAGSLPNIVVLLADDLDVVSFRAAVRAGFLPNITRLFASGTQFRQSFVSQALCSPSRATFFTGLYPHNHAIAGNSGPHGGFDTFTRDFGDNNLAVWMQAAGYNQRIASMRAVDDLLGRVVDAVAAIGELDRTAFVFASDNGYLLGKHRWEAKILLYEEAIRVPMVMRVPGIAGPATVDEIALNNDLAPTIAALAGAAPGLAMDGRSLLPLLDGTATT